ncbi:hypothetical protein GLOTRDRAFT_134208 [Gloeophyllum trabeum ATCC 11539]|uniref:Uncharacterized protein n=1 Tax=Gloeophyllum trabeum (strain ATCC 11539 / FP-39264 / Madison 617) TaxID=670483 RepID=S7PS05_GLOTA|nr:uncharacterized protein GLOTRDRAFT_134208 [Gloeophyllum trabeum ATCC 11539]EPQ50157.1 hypothetical protein GLOTRDRAFT_134208 [Gloeophyllum trabeum ATCC 11539]
MFSEKTPKPILRRNGHKAGEWVGCRVYGDPEDPPVWIEAQVQGVAFNTKGEVVYEVKERDSGKTTFFRESDLCDVGRVKARNQGVTFQEGEREGAEWDENACTEYNIGYW